MRCWWRYSWQRWMHGCSNMPPAWFASKNNNLEGLCSMSWVAKSTWTTTWTVSSSTQGWTGCCCTCEQKSHPAARCRSWSHTSPEEAGEPGGWTDVCSPCHSWCPWCPLDWLGRVPLDVGPDDVYQLLVADSGSCNLFCTLNSFQTLDGSSWHCRWWSWRRWLPWWWQTFFTMAS